MIQTAVLPFDTETLNAKDCFEIKGIARPAPKSKQMSEATWDLANLDLLRSVAVALVFFTHIMGAMRIPGLGDLGHFGVLLFFVHTALVLMLSMGRLGLSGGRLYAAFIVRRIFRIYPLSILTVGLVVAFHIPFAPWFEGVMGQFVWPGWPGILSNLLLTQNITSSVSVLCVLWSLPFEVQMYAFLPLLYILVSRFPSLRVISLIWLAGVAIAGLECIVRIGEGDSEFLLLRYFPCFLAGVFAWRLMGAQKHRFPGALWVVVLIVLITLYRLEDVFRVYGPNWLDALHGGFKKDPHISIPPYLDLLRDWVFCSITGLILPLFSDIKNRWLNAITRRVAMYSYGVYVCHVPMLWICFNRLHFGNVAASAILTVFLTALVSFLLYHFIEHPAIQFGKLLTSRLRFSA
jgi:peptidoglycan/LPS O-acetylase OafA/YrhL